MSTEIENKLDEDFLFYLGFTNSFLSRLPTGEDAEKCNAWLQKLVGEQCTGIEKKRDRNVYLSNLVLCMQDGKLSEPFTLPPNEVDISNAMQVFGPVPPDVQEPDWLEEVVQEGVVDDQGTERKDGRTYMATRVLPGGHGAFAYIAVTMAEEEPKWLGGGEGAFDEQMERKYQQYVPPVYEMEKILARRKDPKEREKVINFYDTLMKDIADEIDGFKPPEQNETINNLLRQLINDMQARGEYGAIEALPERQRRAELLLRLYTRTKARRDKTVKREEVLDEIEEQLLPQSFFETSLQEQDRFVLPATMWEQAINKAPNKKNMAALQDKYPVQMIEKFLELLSNHKEEIAIRLQKRHENIVSQMKKDLRVEGEKGRKWMEDAQLSSDQAVAVLKEVKAAKDRQLEKEKELYEAKQSARSDTSKLYDQLREALYDTQKCVELEAEKGRMLTAQINAVNEQTEVYQQVTDESVRKTQQTNIDLMKNIKKLRGAVKQHEGRLTQIQAMARQESGAAASQQYFYF